MKLAGFQLQVLRTLVIYGAGACSNVLFSYTLIYLLLTNLSKSEYGEYGYFLSLGTICLIVMNLGHKESFFKALSAKLEVSIVSAISQSFVIYNSVLVVLTIALLWFDVLWFWLGLHILATNWFQASTFVLKAGEKYAIDAFLPGIHKLLWSLFFLLLIQFAPATLESVFQTSAAASILVLLYAGKRLWHVLRSQSRQFFQGKSFRHKHLLTKFFLIEVITVLYLKVDILLLNYLNASLEDIADYFLSIQIFDIGVMILSPLGYFFFNRYSQSNNCMGISSALRFALLCVIVSVLMHVFLWLFLPGIFGFVSHRYVESHNLVNLTFFAIYPVVFNIFLSNILIARNQEKAYLVVCVGALISNVIFNYFTIPEFGVYGSAIIKIITELIITMSLFTIAFINKNRASV